MSYLDQPQNWDKKIKATLSFLGGVLFVMVTSTVLVDPPRLAGTQEVLAPWVEPLAHQVISQAEGLAFSAKSQGASSSLEAFGFAARMLSQGVDPRIIRVEVVEKKRGLAGEHFEAKPGSQEVSYERMLSPENGVGLRVRLSVGRDGRLGTLGRSRFQTDVLYFLAFICGIFVVFGILSLRKNQEAELPKEIPATPVALAPVTEQTTEPTTEPVTSAPVPDPIREVVGEWVTESKQTLTHLGGAVRDLLKQTDHVAKANASARSQVKRLRESIHGQLTELRRLNRTQASGQKNLELLAALALLERTFEPLAADAVQVEQSLEMALNQSMGLDSHIKNTSENLMNQARQVQKLKAHLK